MTNQQKDGAMVFFGAANCGTCHNGPGLTDGGFHALGMPDMPGIEVLDASENTYGLSGSDLALGRGGFTGQEGDKHAFKTPQLYNLKDSKFYGHGGTFYNLNDVIRYKMTGQAAKPEAESFLSDDFQPVELTEQQERDLYYFLTDGLYDASLHRYIPNDVLSGNCFPNSDPQSSIDLGCSEPG
jgi:cytochrome c peroxidase